MSVWLWLVKRSRILQSLFPNLSRAKGNLIFYHKTKQNKTKQVKIKKTKQNKNVKNDLVSYALLQSKDSCGFWESIQT